MSKRKNPILDMFRKKQKIMDEEQELSNTTNDEIAENEDNPQIITKFSENEGKTLLHQFSVNVI